MPTTTNRTVFLEEALQHLSALLESHGPACVCRGHAVLWQANAELGAVQRIVEVAEDLAACGSRRWREVLGEEGA